MASFNVFRLLKYWSSLLRSKLKPLTIHTEAVVIDSIWEEVKNKSNSGKIHKWYVMTPANYDYFKSSFNVKLSQEKVSKILKERYKWMINHGQQLELHIHLSMLMNMTLAEQEKMINEAVNWMKSELNVVPSEVVAGWWCYDSNTLKVLKKHNLKLIKFSDYDSEHDYEWGFRSRV